MAGWHHQGAFKAKECATCGVTFLPESGAHKYCSVQCGRKYGRASTEEQYKTISGNFRAYYRRLVHQHRRDTLAVEDLLEIHERQKGLCALSGVPLTCNLERGIKCKTNASIDRLNAGGPYTKENVQLVCRSLNSWRGDTPLTEFIEWCCKVADMSRKGGM